MPPVRLLSMALCLVGVAGCQSFLPLPRQEVRPGQEIRVHLSAVGMGRLAEVRGDPGPTMAGRAVTVDGPRLALEYWRNDLPMARRFQAQRDTLWLPWSEVVRIDEQQTSVARTTLLVGGLAAGAGLIVAALLNRGNDSSGSGPGPDGGTNTSVIPFFRFAPD